jgi:hypothetical protein
MDSELSQLDTTAQALASYSAPSDITGQPAMSVPTIWFEDSLPRRVHA